MVNVSNTYNPYRQARHVDMEIELDVVEHDAVNNMTLSVNGSESISDISQLKETHYTDKKYATCEENLIMLDGTWNYIPNNTLNEHIGWWSNYTSDENGYFETNPQLTATFTNKYSSVGFTVESSKTNPIAECRFICYNDNEVIYDEVFESDNNIIFADIPVPEFNKVIVEVIRMGKPYTRVKILSFMVGILKKFNKDDIVTATITEEVSINSETLPINELNFEVYDPNKYFETYHSINKYMYRPATKNANVTCTNAGSITILNQVKDLNTKLYKYATCEEDFVKLDGTYRYLSNDYENQNKQVGFINNELSDENGNFTNIPTITYTWNNPINFSGLRVFFGDDSYATDITVELYRNNTLIETMRNIENEDTVLDIDLGASECTKAILYFNSVNRPYRYLKIADIQVLRTAESWVSYLTKGRNIRVDIIIDGERVNVGNNYTFHNLEQSNYELTANIIAKDYIAKLDRQHCPAGSNTTITLNEALTNILNNSGITIKYESNSLPGTKVRKTQPKDTSKRAGIHYFTQAGMCTCFLDRNKVLHVTELNPTKSYVDRIDMDNIYKSNIVRMNDYVSMIRLTSNNTYVDPETESHYNAGSGQNYREIENDCVYPNNGLNVAKWLLKQAQRRVYFEIESRGNPAVEIGDTIKIKTRDGTIYFAVVFYQKFEYSGGIKSTIKAVI